MNVHRQGAQQNGRNSGRVQVLIIGSGPAGMTAAIYARRSGLEVLIAEKEYLGTGQIAQTMAVENYPGMKGISGYDLGEAMRSHAEALGASFLDGEAVQLLWKEKEWICRFDTEVVITAQAVICAAGCRYRTLGIPGEEALLGRRIHFCACCDGAFYSGRTAAVIGGSQMAATDALYLSTLAQRVLILYRGNVLRAAQAELDQIADRCNIEVIFHAVPVSFEETGEGVIIEIADGRRIEADGVFEAVGMVPQTRMLEGLTPLDAEGYVIADETGGTALPGLFVAGDVRTKTLRQVITACADGANAAESAYRYLKSF